PAPQRLAAGCPELVDLVGRPAHLAALPHLAASYSAASYLPALSAPAVLAARRRPSRFATPQRATRTSASSITARLILLLPRARSVKVIGTSVTLPPLDTVRSVRSIWKQ